MWPTSSHSSCIRYIEPRKGNLPDYSSEHNKHGYFLPSIIPSRTFEQRRNRRSQSENTHLERLDQQGRIPSIPIRRLTSQFSKEFEILYQIHDGFTANEELLIENALQIVANRLFKAEILENMYSICGTTGYFLAPGLWKRSNLSKHSIHHGKEFLLRYQLMCLKTKGENGEFPIIHIYPIYQRNEVVARGISGCVSCTSHHSTFSIVGEFQIKLNRYYLNPSKENGFDAIEWAGILVHEMLHNLGHNHDHTGRWQMNIFKECFVHDGNYLPLKSLLSLKDKTKRHR